MRLLIQSAEIPGVGVRDVRIREQHVTAVAPRLQPMPEERLVDAGGGAIVPGLIDHHCHLYATAAARESLNCTPSGIPNAEVLSAAIRSFSGSGWIRGYGFHDSVCPGMDRIWLDQNAGERPIRIQHQSGKLWILNSAALEMLGIDESQILPGGAERNGEGGLTGRFYDLDSWLGARIGKATLSLAALSTEFARYGVTAVTDTSVDNDMTVVNALTRAIVTGELVQGIQVMGNESLTGVPLADPMPLTIGPLKIYLREAQLPAFDQLVDRIQHSHRAGRPVAAHCVTRVELIFFLAALKETGVMAGDRVEHASVTDDEALQIIKDLGVTVVTQPHFIAERGDRYLRDVDAPDLPFLYRGKSFLRAGVGLAAGSDGPYGSINPWAAMRAAMMRQTAEGMVMAADERLTAYEAFALFCGTLSNPAAGYKPVAVGDIADLCLLSKPWHEVLSHLDDRHVRMTFCRGDRVYDVAA